MTITKTCLKCQSVYELEGRKTIVRDIDSINCRVCKEEIFRWNGAEMWSIAQVVTRNELKEPPKK